MVGEAKNRAFESAQYVDVGSLGRECNRGRSEARLAIEARTSQTRPGQEMSDGFQVFISNMPTNAAAAPAA